jgi:AcrR family transcriptional regulator
MEAANTLARPRRRRRPQAERRAATRANILEAAVASIAEVGFTRTTATRIAARAGVTWGAVQHHYGDKDGILTAVLDDTFARFAAHFADLEGPATVPIRARAKDFVERAWRHFGSPHFRSTFEILLQTLGRSAADEDGPADGQPPRMLESFDTLWRRVFPDVALSRRQRIALERFTIATLTGLALQRSLVGPHAPEPRAEIELLADTLGDRLEGAARVRSAAKRRGQ